MAVRREVPVDEGEITIRDALNESRHDVEADVLVRVVQGLQKTVRLLAAQEAGLHVAKRFRPPKDLAEHYTLLLGVPAEGSYSQPLHVVDRRPMATEEMDPAAVTFFPLRHVADFMGAVSNDDLKGAQFAIPNERIRRSALEAVAEMVPGGDLRLELAAGHMSAYVDARSRETALRWLDMPLPEDHVDIVCELIGIDFANRRVKLRHIPTSRVLEATYEIEVEEELLRERRDMVQVSAVAMLDDEANPTELVEVNAINRIDLTPITISRVDVADVHLEARAPIVMTPVLSPDDSQFFEARYALLGVDAYAGTREGLVTEVLDEIAFLWKCYALEDPANLTSEAQALRLRLLDAFEVA